LQKPHIVHFGQGQEVDASGGTGVSELMRFYSESTLRGPLMSLMVPFALVPAMEKACTTVLPILKQTICFLKYGTKLSQRGYLWTV